MAADADTPLLTSPVNPAVKAARRLAVRRGRDQDPGALLVESPEVVREALPWLRELYATPEAATVHAGLVAEALGHGAIVRHVAEPVLRRLAQTTTPQGLVGVAVLPPPHLHSVPGTARLVVVLDGVRDPGNIGTAIRTADAAGADAVVLTRGSGDPRNPKAVRASAGSLFHLPVVSDAAPDDLATALHASGVAALLAVEATGARALGEVDWSLPTAVVFGNEAAGIGPWLRGHCTGSLRIPMATSARPGYHGHAESLNVAAAVAVVAFAASTLRAWRP